VEAFSQAIFGAAREAGVDLVVMGGFLRRVAIPEDFVNRVINIHPSLIPAFCGKGNYGRRVHQAVVDYGCRVSGCTVHWIMVVEFLVARFTSLTTNTTTVRLLLRAPSK